MKKLFITFIKKKETLLLLFIVPFCSSFAVEYFLSIKPCILCVIERWSHMVFFILFLILNKRNLATTANKTLITAMFCSLFIGLLITIYHIMIETGIMSSSCSSLTFNHQSMPSCDIPKYLFGIKLTILNLIYTSIEFIVFFLHYHLTIKKYTRKI